MITPGTPTQPLSNPSLSAWAAQVQDGDKWTPWTPTITGGTVSATDCRYQRTAGGLVTVDIHLTVATITGTPTVSLPVTPTKTKTAAAAGLEDVSATAIYLAQAQVRNTPIIAFYLIGTNGGQASITATAPFTWAPGDLIHALLSFQAATL